MAMEMSKKQSERLESIDRMMDYSTGIANEFLARLNRIRSYVPDHNLTSGTANEMILRNFLAKFSTGKFAVGQGFVCHPAIPPQHSDSVPHVSKQCDIIVYDRDYPLVHSEGEVKVVWPQSVQMLVEVKTNLQKDDLDKALENIASAKSVPYMRTTPAIVFAFDSMSPGTVVKHLRNYQSELHVNYYPTTILLLNQGVILHRWVPEISHSTDVYQVRKGISDKRATVMAFLMMFFFDIVIGNKVGGSEVVNMLAQLLEHRTDKILDNFRIGENR